LHREQAAANCKRQRAEEIDDDEKRFFRKPLLNPKVRTYETQ
jgi:hypothetical protein